MKIKKITKSEKETMNLAKDLSSDLKGGEVIALIGELGTGKTIFIKGLAKALGIKQIITSPSFVIMKIYEINKNRIKYLCHLDAYRLNRGKELIDIGLNDWMAKKEVITVIEWADRVKEILPKERIKIEMKFGKKENERVIKIFP